MNGSVLGTGRATRASRTGHRVGDTARTWQLRPWPNDPGARLLVFLDHLTVPTPDDLAEASVAAASTGATALRTSALFPRAADVATANGFEIIDTLALLRRVLDDEFDRDVEARLGAAGPRTAPLRPWQHRRAAEVDQDAFGPLWGNDAASMRDVRRATPVHRARQVRVRRRTAGFAISGAAADSGYVQRVAVARAHRRQGIARLLVLDALVWMRRRGLASAYVNTGIDNAAALALYADLDFVRMDEQLLIAERRLVAA